jgi:nitrogen PTS system EIIA component
MNITEFLPPSAVVELEGTTAEAVLAELCRPFAGVPGADPAAILKAFTEREALGSTGVGEGFAMPHGRVPGLPGLMASFGRSRAGVDFKAVGGKPVHLFFALAVPASAPGPYLNALALVSRMFKEPAFREGVAAAPDASTAYRLLEGEGAK